MTAQLQMQDPFSPMDNSQMVAQMATFSQVAGISEMNSSLSGISETLKDLSGTMAGSRLSDAASWIGKSMLVDSDIATPDRYGFYGGEVKLGEDADNLAIDLVDADGHVLKTFDLGQQTEGETATFYWDGKDAPGTAIERPALPCVVRGAENSYVCTWAAIAGDGKSAM